jgi:hypothetical protein
MESSTLNKNDLIQRLIAEFQYPPKGADLVANKLLALTPVVHEAFQKFWDHAELPDLEIEGYTVQKLMVEHQMKPLAALLTLDWLVREPEKALASLRRGHDQVNFRS